MKVQSSSPQIRYNIDTGNVRSVEYPKPVTLKKALYDILQEKELSEGIIGDKSTVERFIQDLSNAKRIANRKITKLMGYGSSAAVFEMPDGNVLKITDGNHFPMNRPLSSFDVPVLKKGHSGKTYYYVEEKLYQHNMPVYWVDTVKEMIKSKGFRTSDLYSWDTHQIGISRNGKIYLADPECAKYKTVFHAIVDKAKGLVKRRI